MSDSKISPSTLKKLVKITLGSETNIRVPAERLSTFSKPFCSYYTMTELANRPFGGKGHQLFKVRMVFSSKMLVDLLQ